MITVLCFHASLFLKCSELCTFPSLNLCIFLLFPFFLASLLKMARSNLLPTPPLDYKSLYRWAPDDLLVETSSFTSLASIATYRKNQNCYISRIFRKEHERFERVVPSRIGEPMCSDESSNPKGPFCFVYSTVFKKLSLRLPLIGFERALLIEVNVAPTQLHPNNWAFVRAFSILCDHFGHRHRWMSSYTFLKPRAQGRSCR